MKFIFPFLFFFLAFASRDGLSWPMRWLNGRWYYLYITKFNVRPFYHFILFCLLPNGFCLLSISCASNERKNEWQLFVLLYCIWCLSDFSVLRIVMSIYFFRLLFGRLCSHFQSAVKNDGVLTTMDSVICVWISFSWQKIFGDKCKANKKKLSNKSQTNVTVYFRLMRIPFDWSFYFCFPFSHKYTYTYHSLFLIDVSSSVYAFECWFYLIWFYFFFLSIWFRHLLNDLEIDSHLLCAIKMYALLHHQIKSTI